MAEDVNASHQSDRVARCLKNLQEAKRLQGVECDKLAKLRPTDGGFDTQAAVLYEATKKLISARQSYLNCARNI